MSASAMLSVLPDDFSETFFPTKLSIRQRQKGEMFSRNQYVHEVRLQQRSKTDVDISGHVFRSQSKTGEPHNVNLTVDTTKKILSDAHCTCKAGIKGECAHALAVVLTIKYWILQGLKDVPKDQSCTSLPQQWDKPRGAKIQAEPVSAMVVAKPGNVLRKKKPLVPVFIDNRKRKLNQSDFEYLQTFETCPIAYLTQGSLDTVETEAGPQYLGSALAVQIPLIKTTFGPVPDSAACGDLHFPKSNYITIPDLVCDLQHNWTNLNIDLEAAYILERNTQGQTDSPTWYEHRKCRITASNFGRFILRKAPVNKTFLDSIYKAKPFTSAPTTYGKNSEKIARQQYALKQNVHVHDCGLIINPEYPFLAATPDGKVCDNGTTGIIEIKCPFIIRDMTIDHALNSEKAGTLFFTKNGTTLSVKRNHIYWFQIQGQLLVSGASYCDLVIYTRKDMCIERISPDNETMQSILTKLASIYANDLRKYFEEKTD